MNPQLTTALLNEVATVASKHFSGHYTIMKFSTNYKGFFGTPDGHELRDRLDNMEGYQTLEDLLFNMAKEPGKFDAYKEYLDTKKMKLGTLEEIRKKVAASQPKQYPTA